MVQRTDKYSKKVLLQKSLPYTFVIYQYSNYLESKNNLATHGSEI